MAGKLSSAAQVKLATLREFGSRVQHVYGLVEVYASTSANPDQNLATLGRAFGKLKLQLMGAGLDSMSQLCGSMQLTARRGLSAAAKARILRDGVASLKFQLELEQRAILSDEEAAQRKAKAEADDT